LCLKQLFSNPVMAITAPMYNKQLAGEISIDGLGWVWQCNVFGHYALVGCLCLFSPAV
jgi:3-keto steroid reductase